MIKRAFFLVSMVGLVGMPYVMSTSSQWWNSVSSKFQGAPADGQGAHNQMPNITLPAQRQHHIAPVIGHGHPGPIEGHGVRELSEVLQFEGSPAWVMARWPRVTAGLAELDLQGYRVPLVTGTGEGDLAGSLTYYFDRSQRVARIDFQGTTGDPRKLIALVTDRYKFLPQASNDPSLLLYQVKWNGKPQSELRIRPARVVRADQPFARYEIDLAMKRP